MGESSSHQPPTVRYAQLQEDKPMSFRTGERPPGRTGISEQQSIDKVFSKIDHDLAQGNLDKVFRDMERDIGVLPGDKSAAQAPSRATRVPQTHPSPHLAQFPPVAHPATTALPPGYTPPWNRQDTHVPGAIPRAVARTAYPDHSHNFVPPSARKETQTDNDSDEFTNALVVSGLIILTVAVAFFVFVVVKRRYRKQLTPVPIGGTGIKYIPPPEYGKTPYGSVGEDSA